ncbi:hypothetical protein B0T21DRAFT_51209 [Apiosordaria backusii]|uniref:Protein kinase domain-containing protein n=1 Tax=Apiosordaria backusii TaxID=314023 RepID=A0AA40DYQ0_9PEZI|nr:hypothetical protein B0T21DRAFT_51209 [Apiosordaria backusii]
MRLLNTRTLIVEDFYGYSVPPYAILSHTWGSDEVTFQDIQNLEIARLKAGFTKIVYACAQAFRDHLQYTWIDTCCIDKTSSSELSEAINSMYDWYRDSRICYVYLSDVKKDGGDFTRSRWFTRGWTLQELLAPNQVLFFDCKWTRIMNKGSNAHEISIVTGIDSSVLRGLTDIQSQSVAQRMSWMATRTTTRLEDIAYSMLGIFDVHMPLIYGEGRLAFIRLQQEIIRQSNDDSIFAWDDSKFRNPGSPYDGLLAPRPSAFASSGLIVQCPSSIRGSLFRPGSSIAFTNRGLQFHGRPLLEDDVGTPNFQSALMPLACNNSTDNDNSILAVPLTLLPETGHWARAVSRPLHRIDRAVLGYSKNETKSFYTLGSGQYSLRNADYSYTQEKASYDLTARYDSSSALLRALAKLFPSSTIPVQFRIGVYHIELPRKLTPTEEKQLRDTVLAGSHYTRIQEQNERYSDLQHTAQKGDLQGKKQDLLGSLHGSSPTVPEYIPGRPIPILAPDPGRSPGSKAYKFLNLSDADKSGYTWGLYAQSIETGESSTVFQVNAMTSLGKIMGPGATTSPLTVKIAIKRLDHDIAPSYFLREYKALQGITSLDHDNIVEVLCVFRTELEEHQYYNFGFPLALGNLKRLFRGDYNSEITIMSHTQSLWTQFEGLANALVFLHETLHMAHRDIKPSNILFYWDKSGTNLVLRIADFGLSVDLTSAIAIEKESKAASSPWSYDSPEFRNAHSSKIDAGLPSASEVLSNDIWKLGCVFVELETFLALNGSAGITKLREHITTTVSTEHAEFESDTFEDFRFDDGERVKPEVMNWIQKVLPSNHEWAIQLGPILGKMLCGSSQRWSARTVYRGLLKA